MRPVRQVTEIVPTLTRQRCRALLAAVALSGGSNSAGAASSAGLSTISSGVDISDCRSSLRVGPVHCTDAAGSRPIGSQAADPADLAGQGAANDAAIDAFLASYGKPPREAVRALLDPSDENIRALLQKREETIAVASFLAERMSELRNLEHAPSLRATGGPAGPPMLQVRITLYERPGQDAVEPAIESIRSRVERFPLLKAQVGLVGEKTPREPRALIARIPAPLTVRTVRPEDCNAAALPFVRLEDLRSGRILELDAAGIDRESLEMEIGNLKEAGEKAPGAGSPHAVESPSQ